MILQLTKWDCHRFFCALVLINISFFFISVYILDEFNVIAIELRLNIILFNLPGKQDSYQSEKFMRGCRFLEAELQDRDRVKSGRYVEMFLVL
jgi:hypothetical protein